MFETASVGNSVFDELVHPTRFSTFTKSYFQARLRNRLYNLVLTKFLQAEQEKGLTQAELARRIGRAPESVNRLLQSPGNWRLDTVSDLLIGIAQEELDATASSPLTSCAQNSQASDWIAQDTTVRMRIVNEPPMPPRNPVTIRSQMEMVGA